MTRAELHKKYGITRILPPKKLYDELSPEEAEAYEKHMQATKEMFEHWDDEEYWKDMEGDIDQ